ncbi:MAG: KH domain-containing protein [Chloroflexi bacterium]|nr:KH domain-containing protein [Chloroflexota bacterium]
MRELVTYLAQSLVDKPEEVRVVQVERGYLLTLELSVDPDEMGKVIGRQGRIAKALRILVTAAASREGKRASLEIV